MPWNDNANPGPWGSPPSGDGDGERKPAGPGRGPGGPRRPGGPEIPPGLDQALNRLRGLFGGRGDGVPPGAVAVFAAAAFGLWAISGVYIVQPNEEGVVLTFGKATRQAKPGLNYHLPAPIEHVEKVAVTDLKRVDVGGSNAEDKPEESLMLTGDENIVDLDFSVVWRVADAQAYIFTVREPEEAVKAVAESAMREVVGKMPLQAILTSGRGKVQIQAADLMQKTLDRWGAGVTVVEVQIRSANPPTEVVDAFRQVANAGQDAESKVNEANTYKNRVVNEAKGDAAKLTQSAEAYREQAVREALGETARFNQIYGEYKRAPGVTRQRLYIETMQQVLSKSNKVVVDGKGTSAPIILPPDVFRPRTPTARSTVQDDGGAQSGDQATTGAPK
jgi:membrane protease subunit HflK